MGLSGLALCGFLAVHFLGNILLMISPEAFNIYAYKLISNPLIIPMEIGLILLFFVHMAMGIRLTIQNKKARPERYHAKKSKGGSNLASATMPITGMIILIFLISHLFHFKYGSVYMAEYVGQEAPIRDLYKTVIEYFDSIWATLWYILAMGALAIHISHGFQSSFQSLGFFHEKYTAMIKKASLGFSIVVPLGFAIMSLWCHLQ